MAGTPEGHVESVSMEEATLANNLGGGASGVGVWSPGFGAAAPGPGYGFRGGVCNG